MLKEKFLPNPPRVKDLDLYQDPSDASLGGVFSSEGTG
jgi:hypothetical protein